VEKLKSILTEIRKAVVTLSGGVDSSYLACIAKETLGDNVFAITVSSPLLPVYERNEAQRIAEFLKLPHEFIEIDDDETEQTINFINALELSKKDISGDGVSLPAHYALYVDSLAEIENAPEINRDTIFKNIVNDLKNYKNSDEQIPEFCLVYSEAGDYEEIYVSLNSKKFYKILIEYSNNFPQKPTTPP